MLTVIIVSVFTQIDDNPPVIKFSWKADTAVCVRDTDHL